MQLQARRRRPGGRSDGRNKGEKDQAVERRRLAMMQVGAKSLSVRSQRMGWASVCLSEVPGLPLVCHLQRGWKD